MSASMCSDEHTSIVTDFILQMHQAKGLTHEEVFAELRMQNMLSLADRYNLDISDDVNNLGSVIGYIRLGPDREHTQDTDAAMLTFSYIYQACEHTSWYTSNACGWTEAALALICCAWGTDRSGLMNHIERRDPDARWSVSSAPRQFSPSLHCDKSTTDG